MAARAAMSRRGGAALNPTGRYGAAISRIGTDSSASSTGVGEGGEFSSLSGGQIGDPADSQPSLFNRSNCAGRSMPSPRSAGRTSS